MSTFNQKAWRDARRKDLRARKLCVDCGQNEADGAHVVCSACRADRRRRETRRVKHKADERRKLRKELLWKGVDTAVLPVEHASTRVETAAADGLGQSPLIYKGSVFGDLVGKDKDGGTAHRGASRGVSANTPDARAR